MTLNPKQRRFAQEYVIDLNATQAAIRAVYRDDSQVVSLTVEKHVDRERPRVEVEVWRV